jgi:hypothetical protein
MKQMQNQQQAVVIAVLNDAIAAYCGSRARRAVEPARAFVLA